MLIVKAVIPFVFGLMLSEQPLSLSVLRAKGCHILFASENFVKIDLDGFLEIFPDWEEIFCKMHLCNCRILNINFGIMGQYRAFNI